MLDFTYHNPTTLLFGKNQIESLGEHIPASRRVLLVAGGGSIRNNGVHERVIQALAGRFLTEFWGVEPNPDFATLMKAVKVVRDERIDYLLAVGGGSVVDGTKFIAAAAGFEGDPWSILAEGASVASAVEMGCVLTLPATGSEMNPTAVISNRATGQKLFFTSPLVYPRIAILEPETTYSLPPAQLANGIADAFVHVLEQYLTFPVGAALQDRLAESVLLTLVECAPVVLERPRDYQARANFMWSATMALNGLIGQGVPQDWTTHMVGHELTALFGLDHARSLAVVLPWLMRARRDQKRAKLLQYGERIFGIREGSDERRVEQSIERTEAFFESLGLPTKLSAYGRTVSDIGQVVARLRKNGRLSMGERADITPEMAGAALALSF